jgi:hypothetical protein
LIAWQRACTLCRRKFIACLSRQRMGATILSQIETMDHNSQADEVFGQHNPHLHHDACRGIPIAVPSGFRRMQRPEMSASSIDLDVQTTYLIDQTKKRYVRTRQTTMSAAATRATRSSFHFRRSGCFGLEACCADTGIVLLRTRGDRIPCSSNQRLCALSLFGLISSTFLRQTRSCSGSSTMMLDIHSQAASLCGLLSNNCSINLRPVALSPRSSAFLTC